MTTTKPETAEPRKRANRATKPKTETGGDAAQGKPAEPAEATPAKTSRKRATKPKAATEQAGSVVLNKSPSALT